MKSFLVCLAAALLVKAGVLLLDRDLHLYLGDSYEYLKRAVDGYYPTARSWFYGDVVRWIAFSGDGGSRIPLILLQSLATAIACALGGWSARALFRVPLPASAAIAAVFAASPYQLLFDRTLLAESFSFLAFALVLAASLDYLHRPRMGLLALVALLGTLALSLRLVFMPICLGIAVILPVLAWWGRGGDRAGSRVKSPMALALGVSLLSTIVFHTGYRHLNATVGNRAEAAIKADPASRVHRPPAYQYNDGWFLLCARMGGLKPEHAATDEFEQFLAESPLPLTRERRNEHLWRGDGVRARGIARFGEAEGNRLAKFTAIRAMLLAPGATMAGAWQRAGEFYSSEMVEAALVEDLNAHHAAVHGWDVLSPEIIERAETHLGIDDLPAMLRQRSLAQRWFEAAAPLMAKIWIPLPLLVVALAGVPVLRPAWRPLLLLGLVGLAYTALLLLMTVHPSYRLAMPHEALLLYLVGILAGTLLRRPPETTAGEGGSQDS